MLKAIDIACFFLDLDVDKSVFTKNLVEKNDRKFWDGNAKLNKFLHLAQNIYIAKTGQKLIADDFYAYDNGAVVPSVQENYSSLLKFHANRDISSITDEQKEFLKKFFKAFKSADLDELIALSHEDDVWKEKAMYYRKPDQKMDMAVDIAKYKEQYGDIVRVLDRMAS